MSQVAVWRDHIFGLLGYWHHGILCPDGTVIHFKTNTIPKSKAAAYIQRTSLSVFKGRSPHVYIVLDPPGIVYPPYIVVRRAQSKLGLSGYHLFYNNCESFARWCLTGEHSSRQINSYALGSLAGLPGVLLAAFNLSVADCYNGKLVRLSDPSSLSIPHVQPTNITTATHSHHSFLSQ